MKHFIALFFCLVTFHCTHCQTTTPSAAEYLRRAEEIYHKVWDLYRVPPYGLFSEYYPQQHSDTLTYMQNQQVKSKKVSFLWPFSGIFSATNMLVQVSGRKQAYLSYLDSVVAGMEKYRDSSRLPVGYQAYPPMFEKSDRYYDDNGLVALDYCWAFMNTKNPAYLSRAKEAFTFILSGWSDKLGGGTTWLAGHDDQKPACTNGMATLTALKLYEATKDKQYLDWGLRYYNWMHDHLRDSTGLYANDQKTKDGSINHTYWTYNSGSMIEVAVMLYHFTGKKAWLAEAQTVAAATLSHWGRRTADGRISILDMPWFVLVLFRGYDALYRVDGNPVYIDVIKGDMDYVWEHSRDKYGLVFRHWNGGEEESATAKWLLDESCLAEFYVRLALLQGK